MSKPRKRCTFRRRRDVWKQPPRSTPQEIDDIIADIDFVGFDVAAAIAKLAVQAHAIMVQRMMEAFYSAYPDTVSTWAKETSRPPTIEGEYIDITERTEPLRLTYAARNMPITTYRVINDQPTT